MFRGYGDLTRAYYEYRSLRENEHKLSPEEYEEVYLYRKQTRFRMEKDARRKAHEEDVRQRKKAFEAEMQQRRRAFEEDEHLRDRDHRDSFGKIIRVCSFNHPGRFACPCRVCSLEFECRHIGQYCLLTQREQYQLPRIHPPLHRRQ